MEIPEQSPKKASTLSLTRKNKHRKQALLNIDQNPIDYYRVDAYSNHPGTTT